MPLSWDQHFGQALFLALHHVLNGSLPWLDSTSLKTARPLTPLHFALPWVRRDENSEPMAEQTEQAGTGSMISTPQLSPQDEHPERNRRYGSKPNDLSLTLATPLLFGARLCPEQRGHEVQKCRHSRQARLLLHGYQNFRTYFCQCCSDDLNRPLDAGGIIGVLLAETGEEFR